MRKFPEAIQNCMAAFSRLPGVGPKTALRYVFYLLQQPTHDLEVMARTINALTENIFICNICFTYTERETCNICLDQKRDTNILCVVEASRDIATIESTDVYNGRYHVLGGILNPIEGMTPETLRIRELVERLKENEDISEIVLALSPNVHGETTMMFLSKHLAPLNRRMTRLARGLPIGATLEYADEITLGDAFKGRKETK